MSILAISLILFIIGIPVSLLIGRMISNQDEDSQDDEEGNTTEGHYKLGEVYYCKLDWIKEYMLGEKYTTYEEGYDEELDEKLEIINDLQETICPILNLLDNE